MNNSTSDSKKMYRELPRHQLPKSNSQHQGKLKFIFYRKK